MWLIKMWRRGGFGSGIIERFARFSVPADQEPRGGVYIHAVSVGEVLIALKLIDSWLAQSPKQKFILSATTSTGHSIAVKQSPEQVRVIYSPLDFTFFLKPVFRRFQPSQIVLIESEIWPNMLHVAKQMSLRVTMVNARLSERSESRYQKLRKWVTPLFDMIDCFCVQNAKDAERYIRLGIDKEKIHVTGSIKFDPEGKMRPQKRKEFQKVLDVLSGCDSSLPDKKEKYVIMAASTHAGEEKLIGEACLTLESDVLFVVVPRHAERRSEVVADLESIGYKVILRSREDLGQAEDRSESRICYVVDTTGELRDWTAHADVLVVGKSFIGEGGQNPCEAIVAGVPVVCGPSMGNFEPLMSLLKESGGVIMLEPDEVKEEAEKNQISRVGASKIAEAIDRLLKDPQCAKEMTLRACKVLDTHRHAVDKTLKLLSLD